MTGGTAQGARGWRPGAALAGLLALVFLLIGRGALPFPQAVVPISLPQEFWSLLALVLVLGYLGYYTMVRASTRPAAQRFRGIFEGPAASPAGNSASTPEIDSAGPAVFARSAPAGAATARSETEMSKLIEWIEGVSAQIAQWGSGIHAPAPEPHDVEEPQPSTMVLEAARGPEPWRTGTWTELRARRAIEKFLRRQPWAPSTDIAKALHMEVGLAIRVAHSLRDRGYE